MNDDNYMSAETAKGAAGFIEALHIFAKYWKDGINNSYFMGAEHDILYIYDSDIPEDSDDGRRLEALGFHRDDDLEGWAYFT